MLHMHEIKPRIVAALTQAGYTRVQQTSYVKWTKGRGQNVWFAQQVVRTNHNTDAAAIVRKVAGAPQGSVSEAQQGRFDSWYTDGYRSRGTAAI